MSLRLIAVPSFFAAVAIAANLSMVQPAQAESFKSVNECKPGRHVAGKDNLPGKVVGITQGTNCEVRLDSNGETHYYIFWMLHDAGGSAETNDKLAAGKYQCFSLSSGHANYDFMDIILTSPTSYRSGGGNYSLRVDARSRQITFVNGPLAGRPAKLLDGPSIGFGGTTCQLAK